ncbi:hypothetical protein WH50_01970 [Pokkaliibacter plantistimulans]|uniref:EF-hand domain-containing protein n=1 Tax=Pokkaliibacter plantistimulans TaxID=1635171 RepID=A0ABX5M217_9GAMM|nr:MULTISPECIES: EF-hand domain-containing protein [Pokkaliibacter]MDH2434541.1 hypothetical protein [Pokkaliibacter sp. MBI-7]PXF32934.1 hypothetical protein WH50_01970 [Pokkaliibacter plantistimulans]
MKKISLLALCLVVSGTANALGNEAFNQVDEDQNGTISVSEAQINEALSLQFAELDVNQDGVLSAEEFANFQS